MSDIRFMDNNRSDAGVERFESRESDSLSNKLFEESYDLRSSASKSSRSDQAEDFRNNEKEDQKPHKEVSREALKDMTAAVASESHGNSAPEETSIQEKPMTILEKRARDNRRIWKKYADQKTRREKEDYQAYDQFRDNLQKPLDPILQTAFKLSEICSDEAANLENTVHNLFFNDNSVAEKHCNQLEKQIKQATAENNPHAANHFAKREVEFAVHSLKIDHPVTQDLIRRYGFANDFASKPQAKEGAASNSVSVLRLSRIPGYSAMRYERAR